MSAGCWRESAKGLLRRALPERMYDSVLAGYRILRDRLPDREAIRRLLLRRSGSRNGRYPGWLYPKLLSICLTTRCNLRCFICRREEVRGRDLEFGNLPRLEHAIRHAETIDLTGWGECLVYPKFEEALSYILSRNGRDGLIQITSNGTLLSGRIAALLAGHIRRVNLSLNAAREETYNREMQHGDFGKTMRNIRAFADALGEEDRRRINFHFVAHTENFREIPEFLRLARDTGISSVSIGQYLVGIAEHHRFSLLNAMEEYNEVLCESDRLARELGVHLAARRFFGEEAAPAFECNDPYDACFVEVDGRVGPCCFCGSYRIGNVFESGFEAVWFGEEYRKLRKRRYLPACRSCSPFIPFHDPAAHFTAYLKEQEGFREILDRYGEDSRRRGGTG